MTEAEAQNALNGHGSFLKKRVLTEIIDNIPGLFVGTEEIGVSFHGTRVLDILAFQATTLGTVYHVIECKRVHETKSWLFLRHLHQAYRRSRRVDMFGHSSDFIETSEGEIVCSEGYEVDKGSITSKPEKADQDPVFKAGLQACGAYLGFVNWCAQGPHQPSQNRPATVVPILVTTARLYVAEFEWRNIRLIDGKLYEPLQIREVDHLILQQPFPTPEECDADFRFKVNEKVMFRSTTESMYVVRAEALRRFLTDKRIWEFAGVVQS